MTGGSVMVYRNKQSGITFVTPCACEGEDWEEVKASAPTSKAKRGKKHNVINFRRKMWYTIIG